MRRKPAGAGNGPGRRQDRSRMAAGQKQDGGKTGCGENRPELEMDRDGGRTEAGRLREVNWTGDVNGPEPEVGPGRKLDRGETKKPSAGMLTVCAVGETRTPMSQRSLPPQSSVSTISPQPHCGLLLDFGTANIRTLSKTPNIFLKKFTFSIGYCREFHNYSYICGRFHELEAI